MWRKIYRKMKYEYLKLIRMKGASSFIARGFAVGLFVEFITLPTLGIAFALLYPLNKLFRSSVSASLIAFVFGKMVLPLFMFPNLKLGNAILGAPVREHMAHGGHLSWGQLLEFLKHNGIAYFTGSAVMGLVVALGSYFLVYGGLNMYRKRRARRSVAEGNS